MYVLIALLLLAFTPAARAGGACWELAAKEARITVDLLQGIAWTESSMRPTAVNTSHQHVTGTRDIGLVGVNSAPAVLRRLGVSESDLFDPCTNLRTGARILREKFQRYGETWEAVGAYCVSCTRLKGEACRSARSAYAWRVFHAMHAPVRDKHVRPIPDAPRHVPVAVAEPSVQFVSLR